MNLYELFQMWVNHPKKGSGRRNSHNTDECWKKVLQDIRNWESNEDKNDNDFAKYLLYTGKIRRVHLDLNEVNYNNHYVSWTTNENLEDLYWFNSSCDHTIITAVATKDNPGISIKGFGMKFSSNGYEKNVFALPKHTVDIMENIKDSKEFGFFPPRYFFI